MPPEHEVTGSNPVGRTGSKASNRKGVQACVDLVVISDQSTESTKNLPLCPFLRIIKAQSFWALVGRFCQ